MYRTEEIIGQAVKNLKSRSISEEAIDFTQIQRLEYDDEGIFSSVRFSKNLELMYSAQQIVPYKALHSHRNRIAAGIILFFKRVIRRCIKFYIEPVMEDQSRFNNLVTKSLKDVSYYFNSQESYAGQLNELKLLYNKDLKRTIDEAYGICRLLRTENDELRREMESLKTQSSQSREMLEALKLRTELLELSNKKLFIRCEEVEGTEK